MIEYYLLTIWGDVEPELTGPYLNEADRDDNARTRRCDEGDEHGLFALNQTPDGLEVYSYSGAFFEEKPDAK